MLAPKFSTKEISYKIILLEELGQPQDSRGPWDISVSYHWLAEPRRQENKVRYSTTWMTVTFVVAAYWRFG